MDFTDTLSISASGLAAQRVRLQTVASNMANARTTRTADGGPYQRRMPVFEAESESFGGILEKNLARVRVSEIQADEGDPIRIYDPGIRMQMTLAMSIIQMSMCWKRWWI